MTKLIKSISFLILRYLIHCNFVTARVFSLKANFRCSIRDVLGRHLYKYGMHEPEYLDADLFCHPSRDTEYGDREGIPNSILEAMSYGVPVISTSHSGIPEVISDLKTGILIKKDNYDLLANAFIKLLNDKTLCEEISKNSRDLVQSKFSIKECVRSLEESYNSAFCLREF